MQWSQAIGQSKVLAHSKILFICVKVHFTNQNIYSMFAIWVYLLVQKRLFIYQSQLSYMSIIIMLSTRQVVGI